MSGSNWQTYLAPQIEARNRWADTRHTVAPDLPSRGPRFAMTPVRGRLQTASARAVAAVGVAVAVMLAVFVVLVLQAAPSASQEPAPVSVVVTNGHGGGGTHPMAL